MRIRLLIALSFVLAGFGLVGCGPEQGVIPDSAGPPKGGPPPTTEHPPGLTEAEKDSGRR